MNLLSISIFSQQSSLIINNYSAYDFRGNLLAFPMNACYPRVGISDPGNPNQILVHAQSHQGNGLELQYNNYASAGTNSLYPVTAFFVQTSATNPALAQSPNHPSLNPLGPISTNTDWKHTKFQMYFAGTGTPVSSGGVNVPETYFNGNLGDGLNSCGYGQSYISTFYGDAEWFVITGSAGQKFSFIQIY